jgi:hypothetical protein
MRRLATVVGLSCLALASGCNQRPAREAIAAADQALDAGRPQLEAYSPEQLELLRTAVAEARRQLEAGHYTDALRRAQGLPRRVREAVEEAARRRGELDAEWASLSAELPSQIRGLELKIETLRARAAATAGDPLAEDAARLLALRSAWSRAESASSAGRTARAVAEGRQVAAGAGALAVRLGFTTVQAAALANAVAAAAVAAGPPAAAAP